MIHTQFEANFGSRDLSLPEGVAVEERRICSPEGREIALIISKPNKSVPTPRPVVLHIHGGGYIIGSASLMNLANLQLARDADCVVVSVDYRLAPETPRYWVWGLPCTCSAAPSNRSFSS